MAKASLQRPVRTSHRRRGRFGMRTPCLAPISPVIVSLPQASDRTDQTAPVELTAWIRRASMRLACPWVCGTGRGPGGRV